VRAHVGSGSASTPTATSRREGSGASATSASAGAGSSAGVVAAPKQPRAEEHAHHLAVAASVERLGHRPWTHGWLPFPLHAESATQAAVDAAKRAMRSGAKGGWRRMLRKENGYRGKPVTKVDERLIIDPDGEIAGTAVVANLPPSADD
jgi:hypothetical protein